MRTKIALAFAAFLLAACQGSQSGKALNAFDSKSFWESDYSDINSSESFWYSGYSDDDVKKAHAAPTTSGGGGIWSGGVGPSNDSGAAHSDPGHTQ